MAETIEEKVTRLERELDDREPRDEYLCECSDEESKKRNATFDKNNNHYDSAISFLKIAAKNLLCAKNWKDRFRVPSHFELYNDKDS